MVHGFSCSEACGIFPDQGSNPCPLHFRQFTTEPPGKPLNEILKSRYECEFHLEIISYTPFPSFFSFFFVLFLLLSFSTAYSVTSYGSEKKFSYP